MPTVTSTETFEIGPYDTLTLTAAAATAGTIVITSYAPTIESNGVMTIRTGVFGPWGVPVSCLMTVTSGSVDYSVTSYSLTAEAAHALATGGVYVTPTGSSIDTAVAQAAADAAAAAGQVLYLGAGEWDFTDGGLEIEGGLDLNRGGVAGAAYKALEIVGAGIGKTIINVGANQKAFWYSTTGAPGSFPRIANLSIIGPGISSGAIGIQVGGKSSTRSDLHTEVQLYRVLIDNVTSAMIFDDVTGISGREVRVLRAKYHIEYGYNIDSVEWGSDCFWSPDDGNISHLTATITSGSNTITDLFPATTARLQVGYAVLAPGMFPENSYVGSISSTSVTVVDYNNVAVNATASGTDISFGVGRVQNFGTTTAATAGALYPSVGSPFVSPYWSTVAPAGTQGRIGCSNHLFQGGVTQVESVLECPGNNTMNISHSFYIETSGYIARIGQSDQTFGPQGIEFERLYFGALGTVVCPPIRLLYTAPGMSISLRKCVSDSSVTLPFPWIHGETGFGNYSIVWEDNFALNTTLGYTISIGNGAYSCRPLITTGHAFYAGSARAGDAIETKNGGSWEYHGQDAMKIDLTDANVTLPNPSTFNTTQSGKVFTIYCNGITGRTLTLGSYFLKSDGTAVGTVSSGSTGTTMAVRFIWDDVQSGVYLFRALSPIVWV